MRVAEIVRSQWSEASPLNRSILLAATEVLIRDQSTARPGEYEVAPW